MKLLPKNQKCPYCGTVYRYGDLKKLMYSRKTTCYHCKKLIIVSRKGFLILLALLLLVYALLNASALLLLHNLSFALLFIINLIPTVTALVLLPFYIRLMKKKYDDGGQ